MNPLLVQSIDERISDAVTPVSEAIEGVVFYAFDFGGVASLQLDPVIGISDSMLFLMTIPNVIGLYVLARVIKNEIYGYRDDIASGEIAKADPVG